MMLAASELKFYQDNGYLLSSPGRCLDKELPSIDRIRQVLNGPCPGKDGTADRHIDDPLTFAICTAEPIVETVSALLGPDVLLWHSRYFDKNRQSRPVPWHQDAPFWPMQPKDCVSVWVALEDANEANGCVQAVPGSHLSPLPRVPSADTERFRFKADLTEFDTSESVYLTRRRGEYFVSHAWLLHRSAGNPQCASRLALSIQYIAPHVQLDLRQYQKRIPGFGVFCVKGRDSLHLNPHAERRAESSQFRY